MKFINNGSKDALVKVFKQRDRDSFHPAVQKNIKTGDTAVLSPKDGDKVQYKVEVIVNIGSFNEKKHWIEKLRDHGQCVEIEDKGKNDFSLHGKLEIGADPSNWMGNLGTKIQDRDLRQLLIPGTHDSVGYKREMLNGIRTQDLNIFGQLKNGMRFLDIGVTYSGKKPASGYEKNTFYVCNNSAISTPELKIENQLEAINNFASERPKEIILLNFRRLLSGIYYTFPSKKLPDMSDDAKESLSELIRNFLGEKLVPADTNITIGDIWDSGKNIIVFFPGGSEGLWSTDAIEILEDSYSSEISPTLEEKIPHLKKFLDDKLPKVSGDKFNIAVSAIWDSYVYNSAGILNPKVNQWIEEWSKNSSSRKKLNIVTIDFFEHSDFFKTISRLHNEG